MLTGEGARSPSPEQVLVWLGTLVAARAPGSSGSSSTRVTSPLARQAAAAASTITSTRASALAPSHKESTVNVRAGALLATPLNATHQLLQNLFAHSAASLAPSAQLAPRSLLLLSPESDNGTISRQPNTTTYSRQLNSTSSESISHHEPILHLASQEGAVDQHHHHHNHHQGRGPFTSYEWLMIVTLVAIILISIVGNLLVCVAIFTDRRLRKLGNAFIVSLAIADLFVSFLVMTFALHNDLMEEWVFGAWFCDIWISFDIMCCTASILNLCAISLDRFIHIKDCLLYNQLMTRRVAISAVIMIWFISALVSFVPINLGWGKPSGGGGGGGGGGGAIGSAGNLARLEPVHYQQQDYHNHDHQLAEDFAPTPPALAQPTAAVVEANGPQTVRPAHSAASDNSLATDQRRRFTRDLLAAVKHSQMGAPKLNHPAARGAQLANEPIGSGTRAAPRRRPASTEASATQVLGESALAGAASDPRRNGSVGGGENEGKQGAGVFSEFLHEPGKIFDHRRVDSTALASASRPSSSWPKQPLGLGQDQRAQIGEKSNLGCHGPQLARAGNSASGASEQIKHLPRARRRRQLETAPQGSKLPDYEQDDDQDDRAQASPAANLASANRPPAHSDEPRPTTGGQRREPAQCMLTLTPTYAVISSTISFYIPCIIMLGLYSKLFACARRHVRNIKAISKAPQPIGSCANSNTTAANNNNNNNNNHISDSSGPLTPMVNRARGLIGGRVRSQLGGANQASVDGHLDETTCGEATGRRPDGELGRADKQSHPGGKLAQLVGARARTWIKFRSGGATGTENPAGPRCDHERPFAGGAPSDLEKGNQRLSAGLSLRAAGGDAPAGPRLVLKSILSGQQRQRERRPQTGATAAAPPTGQCSIGDTSGAPGETNECTTDDNNTVTRGQSGELEPFLSADTRDAHKSTGSTNATGVKLNMICTDEATAPKASQPSNPRIQILQQQNRQPGGQPHPQPTKQQTSQLATHKAAITLGIIMGTFLLCWLPFFCLNIIKAFYADLIPAWLFRAFTWLGYANSALNPIIYGIHNSEFRNAFNRIFFKHLTLKGGRQYLNRRFSYDHRSHQVGHANSNQHGRRRAQPPLRHSNGDAGSDNKNQTSQERVSASAAADSRALASSDKTAARGKQRHGQQQGCQLAGLAREPQAQSGPQTTRTGSNSATNQTQGNNIHNQNRRTQMQGRDNLASSVDQPQAQECLNLLTCLHEHQQTTSATSVSNTTVHRTSEDLSGSKVMVVVASATAPAEESPAPQHQPTTTG